MEKVIRDFTVLYDEEDKETLDRAWTPVNRGKHIYFVSSSFMTGKIIYLHRALMNAKKGEVVDHANGNTLDNRRSNLRFCTPAQNLMNARRRSDNKTGFKGVRKKLDKLNLINPFYSSIKVNGKNIWLGYFHTAKEAFDAYCEASKYHHGEFSRTE